MIVDPVCGAVLDDFEYPEREEFNGRIYFFSSLECAQKFRANPATYTEGSKAELGEPIPAYTERQAKQSKCA